MENGLKFDKASKEKLVESLSSDAMKLFVENTKAATDNGTFDMIITTNDVDRMGESISLDGWDVANYLKSPVVLWGHNYSLPPIGVTTSLTKQGNGLRAQGVFAPTPMGQQIRQLYDLGMQKAASVGFMDEGRDPANSSIISKAQLLEWSFVSVPANPYALSLRDLGVVSSEEVAGMVLKGVIEKMKTATTIQPEKKEGALASDPTSAIEGEPCITEDGNPGKWTMTDGALVCIPSAAGMPEKKGEVADEMTAEQVLDQKYNDLDKVFDVVFALCDVYLDEKSAVTDFPKLLSETAGILSTMASGTATQKGVISERALTITTDFKTFILKVESALKKSRYIALENIRTTSKSDEDGSAVNNEDDEDEDDDDDTDEATKILAKRKLLQDSQSIIRDALTALKPNVKKLY